MKTRPYVILTPSYCVSAGVRVMHQLCHELNMLGFDASILITSNISPPGTPVINPLWNTPVINNQARENWEAINNEAIFIAPDDLDGNPLNCKRLVYYVLGRENVAPADDYYRFYYTRAFPMDKTKEVPTLLLLPVDLSLFNANNTPERTQDMVWMGKNPEHWPNRPPNVVPITYKWPPTREELAAHLRQTRYLYTYDAVSCTNTEAVLCGAVVIVKHISYHGWEWTKADMEATEFGIGGFAFDESEAELQRAYDTRIELVQKVRETVASFRPKLLELADHTQWLFKD
ncbi:hypothetical protein GCM10027277_32420 [Pseudoduganella ginsengisoli]|uniref:Glycosyltransferase family 1 protein n=1 Tax=Pseudoduganella ginsengisoli TaxID=1462440 RepID=A0A6L6Q0U5_9BURK|nr:hypothetical protein [Pseudoduganella ginsengisoli]MTW02652.1 hypothetical protein [Pseudoduganella ginsengisoli]